MPETPLLRQSMRECSVGWWRDSTPLWQTRYDTADSSTFAIEKQPGLKPHVAVNLISHKQ